MAAAAIILNALPRHLHADIYIDSQATIAALSNKATSERRRIRAPGRAWRNFISHTMKQKMGQFQVHHIRAHQGQKNRFQIGNDRADQVAKHHMLLGEESQAMPYFTTYEEEILLFKDDTLIEGDIRAWLTAQEKSHALAKWKLQETFLDSKISKTDTKND
jgi:hypothetical protein